MSSRDQAVGIRSESGVMRFDDLPHTATLGVHGWQVSWLPGRDDLSEQQARAALQVARLSNSYRVAAMARRDWPRIRELSAGLGVDPRDAVKFVRDAEAQASQQATPTPIQHLAHLTARPDQSDRVVAVDRGAPPVIRTPGRVPGQWLGSGERLDIDRQSHSRAADSEDSRRSSDSMNDMNKEGPARDTNQPLPHDPAALLSELDAIAHGQESLRQRTTELAARYEELQAYADRFDQLGEQEWSGSGEFGSVNVEFAASRLGFAAGEMQRSFEWLELARELAEKVREYPRPQWAIDRDEAEQAAESSPEQVGQTNALAEHRSGNALADRSRDEEERSR